MDHMRQDNRGYSFQDKPEGDVVEIGIRYNKGGTSMFTYKEERRGLYIHVSPVNIERRNGVVIRGHTLFGSMNQSGFKVFAVPLNRQSQKATAMLAAAIDGQVEGWAKMFREKGAQELGKAIQEYFNPATMAM